MDQEPAEQTIERIMTESQRLSRRQIYAVAILGAPNTPAENRFVAAELRAGVGTTACNHY